MDPHNKWRRASGSITRLFSSHLPELRFLRRNAAECGCALSFFSLPEDPCPSYLKAWRQDPPPKGGQNTRAVLMVGSLVHRPHLGGMFPWCIFLSFSYTCPQVGLCAQPVYAAPAWRWVVMTGAGALFSGRLREKEAQTFLWGNKEPGEAAVSGAQVQLVLSSLVLNLFSTCPCKAINVSLKSELDVLGDVLFPSLWNEAAGLSPLEVSSSSDTCRIHIPGKSLTLFPSASGKMCSLLLTWIRGSKRQSGSSFKMRVKGCYFQAPAIPMASQYGWQRS